MTILELAQKIERKYGTNRPDEILACMGVKVFEIPLSGVRGMYKRVRRNTIVFVDSGLDERMRQFVLGHELGHYLLHRGENRVFLDRCTAFVTSIPEKQADTFSVCLMATCPQDMLWNEEYVTAERVACRLGVEERIAQFYINELDANNLLPHY